jgi:hypothetical protein
MIESLCMFVEFGYIQWLKQPVHSSKHNHQEVEQTGGKEF